MNPQAEQVKAAAMEAILEEYKDSGTLDARKYTCDRVRSRFQDLLLNLPAPEPSEFMRWLKDHMDDGDGRTSTEGDFYTLNKFGVCMLWERINEELAAEGEA